jgi:hypothetical protein
MIGSLSLVLRNLLSFRYSFYGPLRTSAAFTTDSQSSSLFPFSLHLFVLISCKSFSACQSGSPHFAPTQCYNINLTQEKAAENLRITAQENYTVTCMIVTRDGVLMGNWIY